MYLLNGIWRHHLLSNKVGQNSRLFDNIHFKVSVICVRFLNKYLTLCYIFFFFNPTPFVFFKDISCFITEGPVFYETHTLFVEQCLGICAENDTCKHASFEVKDNACTIYSGHTKSQVYAGGETLHTFSPQVIIRFIVNVFFNFKRHLMLR